MTTYYKRLFNLKRYLSEFLREFERQLKLTELRQQRFEEVPVFLQRYDRNW